MINKMEIKFENNVSEKRYNFNGVKVAIIKEKNNLYTMYIDDYDYFMDLYKNNRSNYLYWREKINEIRMNMKLYDNRRLLKEIEIDINIIINFINKIN